MRKLLYSMCKQAIVQLCMRKCFRFKVYGCQNVFVEIRIRAAKHSSKIPISYKDINKIKTEFPRSGMHRDFVVKKF